MRTCKGMEKRSLVPEKEWDRLRDAMRHGKAVSIDLEYINTRIRLSTSKGPAGVACGHAGARRDMEAPGVHKPVFPQR